MVESDPVSSKRTKKVENIEANVVIMGGGGGGMAAAVAAAEHGATGIIVLEKLGHLGGNSALATGFFACESPAQKRENIDCQADDCFKIAMKWAHWSRVNPRILRAYLNKSGDTIRWLEEKGVKFEIKTIFPGQLTRSYHVPARRGAQVIKVLTKSCEELGVRPLLRTCGRRILRGGKGDISGVVAVKEGKEFQIKTKSVIIATGGFCGNSELLKKYCPDYYEGMRLMSLPHAGDGLTITAEIGAAIADFIPLLKEGPGPDVSNFLKLAGLGGIVAQPNTVWVNKKGERFIDESIHGWESGNAILMQPDRVIYSLFDNQIRQDLEDMIEKRILVDRRYEPGIEKALQREAKEGKDNLVKISNSWEGIARGIGATPQVLKTTIDEYNSFCEQGHDKVFAKDQRYLQPLRRTPYYAVRCSTGFIETLGGIKVTEHMEVRDTRGNIIPGLYAAGVLPDGFVSYTDCNELPGSPFGFALNSGRIAGENAAIYIESISR